MPVGAYAGARFVRLHGMLFDRINLEQFRDVAEAAYTDLDALLGERQREGQAGETKYEAG